MKKINNYFIKKNILITGASQGIGLEIAKHFYDLNANVILLARNKRKLIEIKKNLKKKNSAQKIIIEKCDVSKTKNLDKVLSRVLTEIKGIDILINNAGIYGPKGKFENISWQEIKKTFEINMFGSIYLIKKIIPYLKKKNNGKIIQMSGGGGASPLPFFSAYATSKAGILRFTENISEELRDYKIDINAIAPGPVNTKMLDEVLKEKPSTVGIKFYNKSLKQKKEGGTNIKKILECIEYFSHEKSNGISGKLISVLWDDWKKFHKFKKELKNSDIGTLRRIVGRDRKKKFFDKNEI